MKHIVVSEFGKIPRETLGKQLGRLQAFDSFHARKTGQTVFNWNDIRYIRATNYVGVIQVPGLIVEILPKIDDLADDVLTLEQTAARTAQGNLLYMLSLIRRIPIRERDIASLLSQKMPLNEALISVFTNRLLQELRKGVVRNYVYREENLRFVRGKILLSPHVLKNSAHKERIFVGYDDFVTDTWLNRILKAGCRRLLNLTTLNRTQQQLQIALVHLSEVADYRIETHHFDKVHLTRNSDRLTVLLDFCRMILTTATPAPSTGQTKTFSLLFPMETVFEEFIARFTKKYSRELGIGGQKIHAQARQRRRWLLRTEENVGRFRLKPDLVIDLTPTQPRLVLDTKWKRLKTDAEDAKNGVGQADLYQMYAYANRYNCPDNVLLYPKVPGVSAKTYQLENDDAGRRLRVEFVDVSIDLNRERTSLVDDLRRAIHGPAKVLAEA